jgi:hypothetical protein
MWILLIAMYALLILRLICYSAIICSSNEVYQQRFFKANTCQQEETFINELNKTH